MTIVVAGGSGFIGTELVRVLLKNGDTVIVIDRKGPSLNHKNLFYIPCDLTNGIVPFNVLERTDAIINLCGNTIARKWTKKAKDDIKSSRVIATRNIIESLANTTNKPPIFISASATGYYDSSEEEQDEHSMPGVTFLSNVTQEWEVEALKAEDFGCRVVIVRTAPVIGRLGILLPLWKTARFHMVGSIFKNDFLMPWIHINDLVRIYRFALETGTLQGVVNAVSPTHLRYRAIIGAFRKATNSVSIGVNPFVRLFYGKEMIDALSQNQKIVPRRLLDKGFEFAYTDILAAIRSLLSSKKIHE